MGASSEAMLRTPSRRQKQNRGSGLATEWLWRMKEREEPSRLTGNTGPFRQNPQPTSPVFFAALGTEWRATLKVG